MNCRGSCACAAKWGCLLTIIALLGWSVLNRWLAVDWLSAPGSSGQQFWVGSHQRDIYFGRADLGYDARTAFPSIVHDNFDPGFAWWISVADTPSVYYIVSIPIWIIASLVAAPTSFLWFRGRSRAGLCPACRYPTGASAICTECGHRVAEGLNNAGT